MKNSSLFNCKASIRYSMTSLVLLILFSLGLGGCGDQRMRIVTYTEYQPVYMSEQEFESAVVLEDARELENPGKIYFYNDYLFINEINKGVHIVDNSDPSNPTKVGFINIPSNKDIAVKGNLLYADSQNDLLVFDIQNMQDAELVSRKEDVFQFANTNPPGFPYQQVDNSKGIVVGWEKVEVERACTSGCGYSYDLAMTEGSYSDAGATGMGGSMARFAITGDYLYAVDAQNLLTFDISSPEPSQQGTKDVGWNIETIFPHQSNLFIGSQDAMYIYDISTPSTPIRLSTYTHFTACDPVVVEGNLAYVTLRSGNRCARGVNRLEVIDIEDPVNPQKIAFYQMINPHGLGIDDGNLFVSEGYKGLKILDARDPMNIEQLRHIQDIKTKDVIPYNDVLMVTGPDGIMQYDYSDINDVHHLSTIPVVKEDGEQPE